MANTDHINMLKQGSEIWNRWREENNSIQPDLTGAELTGWPLAVANLTEANLTGAKLIRANLNSAHIISADLKFATLKNAFVANIEWTNNTMRGKYQGIRGLDSCQGNPIFKRAALDQYYLDSLEHHWAGTWRAYLFLAWGWIDYGRSLSRLVFYASFVVMLYGFIYSLFPELLHWPESLCLDCTQGVKCLNDRQIAASWFTPFYFSIVTYTTLGFGDIHPQNLLGEIIVSSEVIIGYLTLGLLLSVLAEKVARRS